MNILLVDDDDAICIYIGQLLKKWGYNVFTCRSAEQAWQIIQGDAINLVLTDWMMPGLSGIELTDQIRNSHLCQYIYIIILTGRNQEGDVITGIESGADEFLTKPINPKELQARIKSARRIIELEQSLQEKNIQLQQSNIQIQNHLEKLQDDLDAAAQLQRSLLPQLAIENEYIDTAWNFQPADDLAGDMIGLYPLNNQQLGFYLLDVSGHGVPAAMLSVYLHNRLMPEQKPGNLIYSKNSPAGEYQLNTPAQIVHQLNQDFDAEKHNMLYFTMIYGILNIRDGNGLICQAGHPYPLISHQDGSVSTLGEGGFPIGLMATAEYQNIPFKLRSGEQLLLYSDGITECCNIQQKQYGMENLIQALISNADQQPSHLLEKMASDAQQWQNSFSAKTHSFKDDVTLLLIKKR